jgi:hypothetical protein
MTIATNENTTMASLPSWNPAGEETTAVVWPKSAIEARR